MPAWITPLNICFGIITLLILSNLTMLIQWRRSGKQTAEAEKQMRKLKYDLSIKSIGMLEKIEKLTEENVMLKEAVNDAKNTTKIVENSDT